MKKLKSLRKYSTKIDPFNANASFFFSRDKYLIISHNRETLKQEHILCSSKGEAIRQIERMCRTKINSYPALFKIRFIDEYQTPYDKKLKEKE